MQVLLRKVQVLLAHPARLTRRAAVHQYFDARSERPASFISGDHKKGQLG